MGGSFCLLRRLSSSMLQWSASVPEALIGEFARCCAGNGAGGYRTASLQTRSGHATDAWATTFTGEESRGDAFRSQEVAPRRGATRRKLDSRADEGNPELKSNTGQFSQRVFQAILLLVGWGENAR